MSIHIIVRNGETYSQNVLNIINVRRKITEFQL